MKTQTQFNSVADPDPATLVTERSLCSETTLTGESWFHISPPQGI
jgi:hypothetical protein